MFMTKYAICVYAGFINKFLMNFSMRIMTWAVFSLYHAVGNNIYILKRKRNFKSITQSRCSCFV